MRIGLTVMGRLVVCGLALIGAMSLTSGCGERPPGSTCLASSECSTGMCYANRCLDPLSDDDGDGVPNGTEYELTSHPLLVDTDGDGKHDGAEVGPDASKPLDRDGDGRPDVIEALNADADLDCLVDEIDADDATANQDPLRLARDACSESGVCAGQHARIVATCAVGVGLLTCDYSAVPGWSGGEPCDGKDNDCDGQIDEGHTYQGAGIGGQCSGTGGCGLGVVECADGKAVCSTNPGASDARVEPEQCNGLDDDCDGKTDEGFVLDSLHVGAPCYGTGECGVGVVVCGASGKPICSSNPGGPAALDDPEVCDGKDNDCDGLVDEELALNGIPLGQPCAGIGACGNGVVVCGSDTAAVCSTNAGAPASRAQPEVCNGVDDNCDGQTDEGFSYDGAILGAGCVGVGACGEAVVVCGKSGTATCSSMPDAVGATAKAEICNGLDDDCDGQTDEDFVYQGRTLGQKCDGIGECGAGVIECTGTGNVTCSTNPDGSAPQTAGETCNHLDDDCNGLLDDGLNSALAPECVGVGVCAGAKPAPACVGGTWVCDFPGVVGFQGSGETACDGKDNDCDGSTDEGLAHHWQADEGGEMHGAPAARIGAAIIASPEDLWFGGGRVGGLVVGGIVSDELWRLDLVKQTWHLSMNHHELAREGATLAVLPVGFAGPAAQIWLIGGTKGGALALNAVALDPDKGSATGLVWPTPPGHRVGAVAVVDEQAKQLFLIGGQADGKAAAVQRYDAKVGAWLAEAKVPQPAPLAGPVAACLSNDGALWVYGSSGPTAPVFARLPAGAAKWESLPAAPSGQSADVVVGGRLACDPEAGQVWLVGGVPTDQADALIRRYHIGDKIWVEGTDVDYPAGSSPALASLGAGTLLVGLGRDAKGVPDHRLWLGKTGAWNRLAPGLEAVVGSRLVAHGDTLWRVGGAVTRGDKVSTDAFAWARTAAGWLPLPTNPHTSRVFPNVVHDPVGNRLLIWGGSVTAGSAADLVTTALQAPAAGGEVYDIGAQAWSIMPSAILSQLPALAVDPAMTNGAKPTDIWAFGLAPIIAKLQLWRLNLIGPISKQLVWSQGGDGPAFHRGATLAWDPILQRVLLFTINGSLQVWGWSPSVAGQWQKLGQDKTIVQGRLGLFGDPTLDDPLISISYPVGGAKPEFRKVKLSGAASILPWTGQVAPWWGPVDQLWLPGSSEVLLNRGADAAGRLRPGIGRWQRLCGPAAP